MIFVKINTRKQFGIPSDPGSWRSLFKFGAIHSLNCFTLFEFPVSTRMTLYYWKNIHWIKNKKRNIQNIIINRGIYFGSWAVVYWNFFIPNVSSFNWRGLFLRRLSRQQNFFCRLHCNLPSVIIFIQFHLLWILNNYFRLLLSISSFFFFF